jgi:murein DD-endopeptidase MepM/ murein hydrolase activator NlpD
MKLSRRAIVLVLCVACSKATVAPAATPSPRPSPPRTPAATSRACRYVFPLRPRSAGSYGRSHHDYPATDIFAPRGTEVVAVTDGVVDWVTRTDRWDPKTDDPATRGGLSVAIVGLDGVRYYSSHLLDVAAGIAPGRPVAAGDLLGHLDTTGNARGISPHLHFGISHPTRPDDWRVRRGEVSPAPYLDAWRQRRAVTPSVPGARAPRCT